MKTYFRVNNPKDNSAIKKLLDGEKVSWSSNKKYEVGDYILVYISKSSGENPRIRLLAKVDGFKDDTKKIMYVVLAKDLDQSIQNLLTQDKIEENGFPHTQYNSSSYKINSNKKLYEYIVKVFKDHGLDYDFGKEIIENNLESKEKGRKNNGVQNKMYNPLNQILYGPPGTGKTYNTINRALEIIYNCEEAEIENKISNDTNITQEIKDIIDERDKLKKVFEFYKEQGQIEFITFHQSYGYEEFVEGIKASTNDKDEVVYQIEDGIFKQLSINALFDGLIFNNFQEDLNYTELYEILIEKFKKEGLLVLKSKDKKLIEVRGISNKDNLYCYHEKSDVRHTVGKDRLKKLYDKYNTLKALNKLSGIHEEFTNIIGGANQTVYWTILHQILIYKDELKKEEINEELTYDKKKDLIRSNDNKLFSNNSKNHILIIDEINRGNISKIFGELITLIEPSKRIGAEEEIRVKLPYSNEAFGVPQNLYIIGTMNTADRSIAQIDTALRRRFEFVEMMPKAELLKDVELKDADINIQEMLKAINERIEYIYDREHQIGHSYFMPLLEIPTKDKLDEIFKVNIIPLLAEYFYGDWADIQFILNNNFIQEKQKSSYITDNSTRKGKKVYEVNTNFEICQYIKIYSDNKCEDETDNY